MPLVVVGNTNASLWTITDANNAVIGLVHFYLKGSVWREVIAYPSTWSGPLHGEATWTRDPSVTSKLSRAAWITAANAEFGTPKKTYAEFGAVHPITIMGPAPEIDPGTWWIYVGGYPVAIVGSVLKSSSGNWPGAMAWKINEDEHVSNALGEASSFEIKYHSSNAADAATEAGAANWTGTTPWGVSLYGGWPTLGNW